ncbi:MAG: undecaprenyl/decaprenyl-phosphate alpha-N-acetylglucosaminyl 1-phosphate transferase [Solirubrobacterales bacterium]|nr:undecaprenyl/decaprenyl-phosphate alpha-N-acetylglucosaminyl 1-phosphate transferase [Solirubrobacterales bacterium]
MPPEIALTAAFATAALLTFALTPAAIRLAVRTGFLDRPLGYKGHARATPYLGGCALAAGIAIAALVFGAGTSTYAVLLACALGLWAMGTIDDRHNLSPQLRVLVEVAVALVLWSAGLGWDVLGSAPADAALTVLWVLGIVNAFNLMDNMNGAAATTAATSALGAAGLALVGGETGLAALCLAIAGACAGFLPYNLTGRIFMGDGGSMLLGTLVAGTAMVAAPSTGLELTAVVAAALIAGLAILDTTLVSVSRRRAGRPLLSGGRDHLTHRLATRLGSPGRVALALAGGQAVLCAVAVACAEAGPEWVVGAGGLAACLGIWAVFVLDSPAWSGSTKNLACRSSAINETRTPALAVSGPEQNHRDLVAGLTSPPGGGIPRA